MNWRGHPTSLGAMLALLTIGEAQAQNVPATDSSSRQTLKRPIDAGVGDVNPLSASLRDMRIDLRQPVGFENVYRVPGRDDMLMRSSGALTAVFPQSAYVQTPAGLLPVIPAGTVFYIGDLSHPKGVIQPAADHELEPGERSRRVRNRLEKFEGSATDPFIDNYISDPNASAPTGAKVEQNALPEQMHRIVPATPASSYGPTIATDDGYRARRLAELLARAAGAGRGEAIAQ